MRKTPGTNLVVHLFLSITFCVAFTGTGSAQGDSKTVLATERQAIQRLFAALNSRNAEEVVAAFTGDGVYEDVAAGEVNRGKDKIRIWIAGAFKDIENFKLKVVSSSLYKDGGIVEWVWSGTDKSLFKTGKSFSVRGVSVVRLRNGKVSSYREYYDFATVMRQLGLYPPENERKQ